MKDMLWLDKEGRAMEGREDVEVSDVEGGEDVEGGTSGVEVDTVRVRVDVEEDMTTSWKTLPLRRSRPLRCTRRSRRGARTPDLPRG